MISFPGVRQVLHIDITVPGKQEALNMLVFVFSFPKVGQQSVKRSSGIRLEPLGRWHVSSQSFGKEAACDLGSQFRVGSG